MKYLSKILFITLLATFASFSQAKKDTTQITVPEFLKDKEGKKVIFDYNLGLQGFSHPGITLSSFEGQNLVFFYFSATCPHCQHAIPLVGKLAEELKKDSVAIIASAVANNSDEQMGNFITTYKVKIPMFRDVKREFSRKYGTGRVPVTLLINKKGEIIRFAGFEPETPQQIKKALGL